MDINHIDLILKNFYRLGNGNFTIFQIIMQFMDRPLMIKSNSGQIPLKYIIDNNYINLKFTWQGNIAQSKVNIPINEIKELIPRIEELPEPMLALGGLNNDQEMVRHQLLNLFYKVNTEYTIFNTAVVFYRNMLDFKVSVDVFLLRNFNINSVYDYIIFDIYEHFNEALDVSTWLRKRLDDFNQEDSRANLLSFVIDLYNVCPYKSKDKRADQDNIIDNIKLE